MQKSFSIAPMLDLTDRHFRALLRLLTKRSRLYTEMVVAPSIIYGDQDRFLGYDESEHPLALQLGGSDPAQLATCAKLAEERGYDEVNLNVGCPSDRVKNGHFGACLMAKPDLVANCVDAMKTAVDIPISVKTRLGIDEMEDYEDLHDFIDRVRQGGCDHFIVHARKAWLQGLSPKQNRTVPPLHYDRVYRLKADFPGLRIEINGGITTLDECKTHLQYCDGVMLGREVYQDPWLLTRVDRELFGDEAEFSASRIDVVNQYRDYIERQLSQGVYLRHMSRHMLQLFYGQTGAKSWRRYLSENGPRRDAGMEVIDAALEFVKEEAPVLNGLSTGFTPTEPITTDSVGLS